MKPDACGISKADYRIVEDAFEFVSFFYDTTRDIVEELYMDEVAAYISLTKNFPRRKTEES